MQWREVQGFRYCKLLLFKTMSLDEIQQGNKSFPFHCSLLIPLTHSFSALKIVILPHLLTGASWDHLLVSTPVRDKPLPPFLFSSVACSLCCDFIAPFRPSPGQAPYEFSGRSNDQPFLGATKMAGKQSPRHPGPRPGAQGLGRS